MKIAHIITRLIIGGAMENTLFTCEDHARDHGDDVLLLTGPTDGPEGTLMPRALAGPFRTEIIPSLQRSIRPWKEYQAHHELMKVLKAFQPDVVHTHTSKAGIVGRAAAASAKIPCVHTVHGSSFHYGQSPIAYHTYVQLERWAARRTAHFISVCNKMTDIFVDAKIAPREKFTTIYSGFDVEPFLHPPVARDEMRRKLGLQDNDVVVGKIGRLFPLKGHEQVIAAAKLIVPAHRNVKFLIVGDGILRPQYEQDVASAGLKDNFIWTGMVPPEEIPALMGAMDIVLHASQWEGLARVLPQGLIAGKPVVSFAIDGAPEVVRDGETGFLAPLNDTQALANGMVKLIADPELRAKLGSRGRELFTDQFRHQTMSREIRRVYERVVNETK